jgi:hypothetical protein
LLVAPGCGALAWRRVAASPHLASLPAGEELQLAHFFQVKQEEAYRLALRRLFDRLAESGVEAILVKGWSVARLYPGRGLRPCGDLDLLVRPRDLRGAHAASERARLGGFWVDFEHIEVEGERALESLFERARTASIDGTEIRVLSPEDLLRWLCLHFFRHGSWRPLWLCDIAVSLESGSPGFDWTRLLEGDAWKAERVRAAVRLAMDLLGAEAHAAGPGSPTPAWLEADILRAWAQARAQNPEYQSLWAARGLRGRSGVFGVLWPPAVEAAARLPVGIRQSPTRHRLRYLGFRVTLTLRVAAASLGKWLRRHAG